jgi:hypothetical protein
MLIFDTDMYELSFSYNSFAFTPVINRLYTYSRINLALVTKLNEKDKSKYTHMSEI